MKKLALALLAALAVSSSAQALETGVTPKVTELGIENPTTRTLRRKFLLFL